MWVAALIKQSHYASGLNQCQVKLKTYETVKAGVVTDKLVWEIIPQPTSVLSKCR